jgi:hypothetical protein
MFALRVLPPTPFPADHDLGVMIGAPGDRSIMITAVLIVVAAHGIMPA